MRSYEALQRAIRGRTVEHARKLGLSTSLVNKWQEPSTDWSDSGAYNPLDRIETVIETAQGLDSPEPFAPLDYLARRFRLVLVPLPDPSPRQETLTDKLIRMIEEFSDLTKSASTALADGRITPAKAENLEAEGWKLIKEILVFLNSTSEASR